MTMHVSQTISLTAVFNGHGEILLLERPGNVHCGELWSFPGGKVDVGESPLNAARRELLEETELVGIGWHMLGDYQYVYPDRTLKFYLFGCNCRYPGLLNSAEPHAWISVDRLKEYPMPEANQPMLKSLQMMKHAG